MNHLRRIISFIICVHCSFLTAPSMSSDTFSELINTLTRDAYFPVDLEKATVKALDAFTRQSDSSSCFLGPEEYQDLLSTTAGGYYGIGIELAPKKDSDAVVILQVKLGGPAHKAGVKAYDKIIAIDGTVTDTLTIDDALKKLRGTIRFSPVTLTLLRGSKSISTTIKRDSLSTESVWSAYLPDQEILYCHVHLFTQQVAQQLKRALEKGITKKLKGIVLDLRDNTGGALQAAVDCASLFLPQNSLVTYTKNRQNTILKRYRTESPPLITQPLPVIILVNRATASAAELFAQALSIYSKKNLSTVSPYIFTVGTQTFGKGSVQDVRPIGNKCALKLTTALYYLPDDSTPHNTGIVPDFRIKQQYPLSKKRKQLQKLYSSSKITKLPTKKQPPREYDHLMLKALKQDHQIFSAVHLIQLLDLGKRVSPQQITTHKKALSWLRSNYALSKTVSPIQL